MASETMTITQQEYGAVFAKLCEAAEVIAAERAAREAADAAHWMRDREARRLADELSALRSRCEGLADKWEAEAGVLGVRQINRRDAAKKLRELLNAGGTDG